jgi:hypothetical protein
VICTVSWLNEAILTLNGASPMVIDASHVTTLHYLLVNYNFFTVTGASPVTTSHFFQLHDVLLLVIFTYFSVSDPVL